MEAFTLDTSGRVECSDPAKPCVCYAATWDQLNHFTRAATEALFAGLERENGQPFLWDTARGRWRLVKF
jgi:hypothetical protein